MAFLSTYPVRGTTVVFLLEGLTVCISIHVPRAGYDGQLRNSISHAVDISIHVPRAGYDIVCPFALPHGGISIHVPRAGYDMYPYHGRIRQRIFLSTYPVRGTTGSPDNLSRSTKISIHVPRAGYDSVVGISSLPHAHFYPRTPCGVRQQAQCNRIAEAAFLSTYPVRGTTDFCE